MTRIQKFQNEQGQWSDATFGAHRDPRSCLAHLVKELSELINEPFDIEEYADCLMLLLDAGRRAGLSADDILAAGFFKLEVNKGRKWGKPDALGVVEHIRG